ncbi:MAG: transglutaminase family protein [Leptospiraceae bacterium]|nr:transglutaminase family protein [Leptospiraceae bacterium]MCP5496545.1 transglutaminase family protein [Leptospiraceae bacterium]
MKARTNSQITKQIQDLITKRNLELYIGGEPTFVVKNPIGDEWNSKALGDEKYKMALALVLSLSDKVPEGSVFFKPVGKLYPGELAARWSFKIIYRKDKKKIWNGNSLMANFSGEKAKKGDDLLFLTQLAKHLKLDHDHILAAYTNPHDNLEWEKIQNSWEATSISDKEEKLLGHILPLNRIDEQWVSEQWKFLGIDKLYALNAPGQLGLKLPLNLLVPGATMAAITAEIQEERLCVFIPPLKQLEDFLSLLYAIEEVCVVTNLRCLCLDGYLPPLTSKFQSIGIIPDPGVLEVNLPPCSYEDWEEYEYWIDTLFTCAEKVGLYPYRWKYTGEKTGTGGGGHVTLGGSDLENNPFFKIPHLLPSFIRFFQNHPSMSYLFSGQYIGPTSQAARIDEGLADNLHELELTLEWAESLPTPIDKELFQNNFRNLLTDLTGNTHRSEITIDKLANQFMKDGYLGVVEFRAFEMPTTLDNYLLLGSLIFGQAAIFMNFPYKEKLIDFGSSLHDKYFLPFYIWEDFCSVISYLNEYGVSFNLEDFKPFFDFRFPILYEGEFTGGEITIRKALELWPVMAEQSSSPQAATSRLVDASMYRIQFEVFTTRSIVLLVNGQLVPLVWEKKQLLGAVRYKAYYSFPSFQVHIPPLPSVSIEIVCTETKSILFSAIHYSWKPGITPYDGLPCDEEEATKRLNERFKVLNVSQNTKKNYALTKPNQSQRFSSTLDLRKVVEINLE